MKKKFYRIQIGWFKNSQKATLHLHFMSNIFILVLKITLQIFFYCKQTLIQNKFPIYIIYIWHTLVQLI